MAATDKILVSKEFTNDGVTTRGVEELQSISTIMAGATATLTAPGTVKQGAFVAAAAVPFADLTAAANAFNSLRTSLINAGTIAAS